MKVSEVLSFMNCQYTLRGDALYDAAQDISQFDIDWVSTAPTNNDFHAGAISLQQQNLVSSYSIALQNYIDCKAQEKSYKNGALCVSYQNSINTTWKNEADAFGAWRDNCWQYAIDIQTQVENNEIQPPSVSDFLAGAPILTW